MLQMSFSLQNLAAMVALWTFSSNAQAASWLEIIQQYTSTNSTTPEVLPAPGVPPSGVFTFEDKLWDSSQTEVSIEEVQRVIGCPKADNFGTFDDNPFGYSRIPTEENTWKHMYAAYHAVVPPHEATITKKYNPGAFVHPVEVFVGPIIGRTVRTTTFIPKGTLVWRPRNAAEFKRKEDYRRFLEHIMTYSTPEVACDAIRWSYTSKASPKEDDYVLCVDMDEGSVINMASTDENLNVAQLVERIDVDEDNRQIYGCQVGSLYATRDIPAGEELRMDYGDFSEGDGFWAMGIDPTGL
jgi:hypothetical protein